MTSSDQMKAMIPYWCHLIYPVKMNWRRMIFKPRDNWDMDCVCVPFRGLMDKTKDCIWTGYSSRCQEHQFVSRTATQLDFSRSTVSCVYQEWSTTQRTSRQLDTTVGSIVVNMSQDPRGTLWHLVDAMLLQIEAGLRAKRGVELHIRKVFLMFCTLSVFN